MNAPIYKIPNGPLRMNNVIDHIVSDYCASEIDEHRDLLTAYQAKLAISTPNFKKGQRVDRIDFKFDKHIAEIHMMDFSEQEPIEILQWQ